MNFSLFPSSKVWLALLLAGFLSACDGLGLEDDDDDNDPDSFTFVDEEGASLFDLVESNEIEVSGINTDADIRIEDEDENAIGNGQYSINGGAWTSDPGRVSDEDEVRVRVRTANTIDTEVETTLFIGDQEDTFTVRTLEVELRAKDAFKALDFSWPTVEGASYFQLWQDLSGTEDEFTRLGNELAGDVTDYRLDVAVHRFPWLSAIYELETCTEAECSFTDEIPVFDYMRKSIGYMKAINSQADDSFGVVAISADGQTLAVGAPGEDGGSEGFNGDDGDNSLSGSGAVYIYVKDGDDWSFQTYIKASNSDAADAFGTAVALSGDGNTLVVGAPFEDSSATGVNGDQNNNDLEDSGAVYVFRRQNVTWTQQAYLKSTNPDLDDEFGSAVTISSLGSNIVISAAREDGSAVGIDGVVDEAAIESGAVYTFSQVDGDWVTGAYIKAPNTDAQDAFGGALALNADGTVLVVGAAQEQSNSRGIDGDQADNSLDAAGAAYVYARAGNTWSFDTYLKASNTLGDQRFGTSVAVSADGTTVAVGATGEDSIAIGIDGDQSDTQFTDSGAAYVYFRGLNDTVWTQQAYVKASNGDIDDFFGTTIALNSDGNLLAVGAIGEDSVTEGVDGTELDDLEPNSGAVYVYERSGDEWAQLKYVKAPNTDREDSFGASLSLDASGDTLAVGAPGEDSESTGIGDTQTNNEAESSGAAYLY